LALADTPLQSLPPSSHCPHLCVSVCLKSPSPFSFKGTSY
jgi:hypothetical protein